jgi:3-oxoadipate CoA-transferase, beta subunit
MKPLNRRQIAWRVAQDLQDGMVVNLGIGMPVHCSDYVPAGRELVIQSENGVIGAGPLAAAEAADRDLVDAGSRRITLAPGGTVIDSAWSFAMIRGGHIDVTVLGAFEVAENGDLANWDSRIPDKGPLVGGAMDLAASAKAVWIMMEHTTKEGAPRLLPRCTLPLTAPGCVRRVYTDLAVVDVTQAGFVVSELLAGLSAAELQARTAAILRFAPDPGILAAPDLPDED